MKTGNYSRGWKMNGMITAAIGTVVVCMLIMATGAAWSSGGEPVDPTATFSRVQNEVFAPTCSTIGCHDRLGQQSNLILSQGDYANIVNHSSRENTSLKRIAPSEPANCYLYRKVTGAGITGDRMPQMMAPLTDAKIKLIRDWIRRGAPND